MLAPHPTPPASPPPIRTPLHLHLSLAAFKFRWYRCAFTGDMQCYPSPPVMSLFPLPARPPNTAVCRPRARRRHPQEARAELQRMQQQHEVEGQRPGGRGGAWPGVGAASAAVSTSPSPSAPAAPFSPSSLPAARGIATKPDTASSSGSSRQQQGGWGLLLDLPSPAQLERQMAAGLQGGPLAPPSSATPPSLPSLPMQPQRQGAGGGADSGGAVPAAAAAAAAMSEGGGNTLGGSNGAGGGGGGKGGGRRLTGPSLLRCALTWPGPARLRPYPCLPAGRPAGGPTTRRQPQPPQPC